MLSAHGINISINSDDAGHMSRETTIHQDVRYRGCTHRRVVCIPGGESLLQG